MIIRKRVTLKIAAAFVILVCIGYIQEIDASSKDLLHIILESKGFSVPSKDAPSPCEGEGKWEFGHYDEGWGWKLKQAPCDPMQELLIRLIAKAFHLDKKEQKIELVQAKGDAKAKVIQAKGEAVALKKGKIQFHEHAHIHEKPEPHQPEKHPKEESAPIFAYFTPIKDIEREIAQSRLVPQLIQAIPPQMASQLAGQVIPLSFQTPSMAGMPQLVQEPMLAGQPMLQTPNLAPELIHSRQVTIPLQKA